ncbi:MAG: RNA-directed DNA polymerase [candidate division Zixibacteria bacterium]|nr:RNA-directed DNA polymerase [candidate division Zixibacteria bacterium]
MEKKGKRRPTATPIGRFRFIVGRLASLLQRLEHPKVMHGGLRGRSTRTYAQPHVGRPAILKSDLESFFPNVRPGKVYNAFIELRCSPDVARFLTRLTTLEGGLPQGSPTSTVVGNIVTHSLARRLDRLAKSFNGTAGTYVDDIVVSGPAFVENLAPTVKRIIEQEGFRQNTNKTKVFYGNEEQVVTGVRVNSCLDAPSAKVRETRDLIDSLDAEMEKHRNGDSTQVLSIRGKIAYIGTLNRGAAESLSKRLRRALR